MGPLDSVRVVELAGLAPAPFGCMVLADLGAEVVRISRPEMLLHNGLLPPSGPLDRGKYSLPLDLKDVSKRETLLAVADKADVFVEGFRPGVVERLGLGPQDLLARNPRLIYARMTGWGQTGPLATTAGHDINYIALSGVLGLIGPADRGPVPPANLMGDFGGGGMLLALGIIAALFEREKSGNGQIIDAAMVDGAALCTTFMHGLHAAGRWNEPRGKNMLDGAAPFYDTYECADARFVAVGCVEHQFFAELLHRLGIASVHAPAQMDVEKWPELRVLIAEKFKERTRDDWAETFAHSDACVTPVLSPWEAHEHPHNRDRMAFLDVAGCRQPAPAPRFSRTPAPQPAPTVTDEYVVLGLLARWGITSPVTPNHTSR